jgi:hypothetical protein
VVGCEGILTFWSFPSSRKIHLMSVSFDSFVLHVWSNYYVKDIQLEYYFGPSFNPSKRCHTFVYL